MELLKAVAIGLAMLLPLANPLTTVALLLGLSQGMTEQERNRQAFLCACYVFAIMMVAFYAGQTVMSVFGISISGLRIAGGMIVAYIGFRMLFPSDQSGEEPEVEARSEEIRQRSKADIAFIPLAMPSTAGPGTIALIISTAAAMRDEMPFAPWVMWTAPALTFLLASVVLLLCLRSAGAIIRLLGQSGIEAFGRLMGFLLVCLGVQFVINGVLDIVEDFPAVT
ncbi:MAG TPA: MarC family NAAT transporter [Stenotrophomonas sp.]|nr:MarC family NAAT transporter [Stenotrophomonas sp.]